MQTGGARKSSVANSDFLRQSAHDSKFCFELLVRRKQLKSADLRNVGIWASTARVAKVFIELYGCICRFDSELRAKVGQTVKELVTRPYMGRASPCDSWLG
jgi:hypothetical protein